MAAPAARRRAGLDAPSSLVTHSLRSLAPQSRRRGPPGLPRSSVQATRPKHLAGRVAADLGASHPSQGGGRFTVTDGSRPGLTPYREGVSPRIGLLRGWLGAHPMVGDGLPAVLLFVAALPQLLSASKSMAGLVRPDTFSAVLTALTVGVVVLRRRWPLTVLVAVIAGITVMLVLHREPNTAVALAFFLAIYTVAAHRPLAASSAGG